MIILFRLSIYFLQQEHTWPKILRITKSNYTENNIITNISCRTNARKPINIINASCTILTGGFWNTFIILFLTKLSMKVRHTITYRISGCIVVRYRIQQAKSSIANSTVTGINYGFTCLASITSRKNTPVSRGRMF